MSSWSLLLCEGAHDQEFLCCLATGKGSWQHAEQRPPNVLASLPGTTKYLYLTQGDQTLVVANLNGVENILGKLGVEIVRLSLKARTVAVILDADEEGVAAREEAVRAHYGPSIVSAAEAAHGVVAPPPNGQSDPRRFGLWVAPDGAAKGSLDSVIRMSADALHPKLTPIADKFVAALGEADNHQWNQFREKAVLGSLGQLWNAGGSLASALQERDRWVSAELTAREPFCSIIAFMARLVA